MGSRDVKVVPRVVVSVSQSMAKLRRTQGILNGFWQTTELAYGYLLSHSDELCRNPTRPTVDVLGYIQSEVWYPNDQGRIKRADNIGRTLEQVRQNTVHAYRATLLSFFASFEDYLETEVSPHRPPKVRSWGEYVRSLSSPILRDAKSPLPLHTVLCADFCREIRNRMIHENFSVPTNIDDPVIKEWKERLSARACDAGWPAEELPAAVDHAAKEVIGNAVQCVDQARKQAKELPFELFYMLFTFTNLDSLAFAIEEALLPVGSRLGGRISRKKDAVRRDDLVLEEVDISKQAPSFQG